MKKRTYTIAEAAELTGLTRKALARRVERGSLQSLVRGGRRMIPHAELVRTGLILDGESGERPAATDAPAGGGEDITGTDLSLVASLMRELMDRLERQAGEIAQFRQLTVQAESLRLEREMTELRSRLASLEGKPEEGGPPPAVRQWADAPTVVAQPHDHRLWLPPTAAAPQQPAQPAPRPAPPVAQPQPQWQAQPRGITRAIFFILEALFIVGVAVCAWRLDLRPGATLALVATAWLLVACAEWLRWAARRG